MVDVPASVLEERRAAGVDRRDEMWNGTLHMVPPPSGEHQRLGVELMLVLAPRAKDRGLVPFYETGLFRPGVDSDYRVPDQIYTRPDTCTERGVDGAASVVVEIRSPEDETYDKLGFYADLGVAEVLVIHTHERRCELFVLRGGSMVLVQPDEQGRLHSAELDAAFATAEGPCLLVEWPGGAAEI